MHSRYYLSGRAYRYKMRRSKYYKKKMNVDTLRTGNAIFTIDTHLYGRTTDIACVPEKTKIVATF